MPSGTLTRDAAKSRSTSAPPRIRIGSRQGARVREFWRCPYLSRRERSASEARRVGSLRTPIRSASEMPHEPLGRTQRLYARSLRRGRTPAENTLWKALRARRFMGLKFRRQHPIGPFVLDFYCPERNLAIELDGGGHAAERSIEEDRSRAAWLARRGVRLLRFWTPEVDGNLEAVLASIARAAAEAPSPAAAPRPLPRGEA